MPKIMEILGYIIYFSFLSKDLQLTVLKGTINISVFCF